MGQSKGLSSAHLRLFVTILIQNEAVFAHFISRLTVEHFDEECYQLLFRLVVDYWAEHNSLPAYVQIQTGLETFLEEDPYIISESAQKELEEFLAYAFDPELFTDHAVDSEKIRDHAFKLGKKFLLQFERKILEKAVHTDSVDQLPFSIRAAQSRMELIQLASHAKGATLSFPDNWDKVNSRMLQSTGVGFLDKYLGGGTTPGEVYGLMGPIGSCKTTVAVMLWCAAAQQCYEETFNENWDGRKGLSVLVTYEAPLSPEVQQRSLMYAGTVSRYSLDKMGTTGLAMLAADPENPLPYEKKRFATAIKDGVFRTERQRVEEVVNWMNPHTFCLDFSGSDPDYPTAGHGGISEIVQRIKMELQARKEPYYIKNVIIDYIGLMVDRDNSLGNDRNRFEDHKTYQQAGEQIGKQICKYFKCHAWAIHQLSGSANAMLSPTKTLHHTDAKGSKMFAENLDFAFVFGNLNLDQLGQVACTKHRRFRTMTPTIIQVDGEFNLVTAPDNFHIDSDGKIVDKSTLAVVGELNNDNYDDELEEQFSNVAASPAHDDFDEFTDDDDQ